MRVEVIIGDEEPRIYPLSKSRISLGSGESCDIEIKASGVSRKHIIIVEEDDQYFAVDQGSTNGSFINEQRLVPGRKVEFTSFFPLRLGDSVLLSLLSDKESGDLILEPLKDLNHSKTDKESPPTKPDSSTRILSLKELQGAKTENLVKKRNERIVQKRSSEMPSVSKTKDPDKARMMVVKFFILGLVGVAGYYNFLMSEQTVPAPEVKVTKPVQKLPSTVLISPALIEKADLTPRESLTRLINDFKCVLETEKYLCGLLPGLEENPWGASAVGTMINVLVDGTALFNEARSVLVKPKDEIRLPKYEEDVKFLAVTLLVKKLVSQDLDLEILKNVKLTFALFQVQEEKTELIIAFALYPKTLQDIKTRLSSAAQAEANRKLGRYSLDWMKTYMVLY